MTEITSCLPLRSCRETRVVCVSMKRTLPPPAAYVKQMLEKSATNRHHRRTHKESLWVGHEKTPASGDTGARRMRPPEGRTPSEGRLAGHGAGVKAFAASAHASSVGTDAVWRPSDRTILTFDLAMVAASTQEWCSFDGAERLERAECKALRTSGSCGSHILHWWTFRRARFDRRNYRRCNSFRPPRWKDSAAVALGESVGVGAWIRKVPFPVARSALVADVVAL